MFSMYPLMSFSFAYMDVPAMWQPHPHSIHAALAGEVLGILQAETTISTYEAIMSSLWQVFPFHPRACLPF